MKLNDHYTAEEQVSFIGKKMNLVCTDGEVIKGKLFGYTSKYDSDEGQVHVDIYSPRMGFAVDVAEDEIVRFYPAGENESPGINPGDS